MAFFELEPWGYHAEWVRTANLLALTANIHRAKGRPAVTAADFMPEERRPEAHVVKQSMHDQKQQLMAIAEAMKARRRKRSE